MAGDVISAEVYAKYVDPVEGLTEEVDKFHPLG
jgi:hypothetical protein